MRTQRSLFALAAVLTACAGGGSGGGAGAGGAGPAAAPTRRSGNVITQQEASASAASNAYDLIRQIRPQWLVTRGSSSPSDQGIGGIQVYVDGVRRGGLDALVHIGVEQVGEIRFIDSNDATTRYGTGHVHGAIEVRTRR